MVRWYRNVLLRAPASVIATPSLSRGKQSLDSGQALRNDNQDQYIPPDRQSRQQSVPRAWGFFSKRKALEEIKEIISKASRLAEAPDSVICYFMENDLERLMQYGEAMLMQTQQLLAGMKNNSKTVPWVYLLRVAVGDSKAILPAIESAPTVIAQGKAVSYLYGLQKLSARFPKEATHLAKPIFERGDLNVRLTAFRVAVVSPTIGDGKMIGEWFVKLMAATTHEERREIVEPFFQNLLAKGEGQNKLAWLSALYHGWCTEREEA